MTRSLKTNEDEDSPDLMTVKEAAAYLRISLASAYYLIKSGRMPVTSTVGPYRIRRSELDRMAPTMADGADETMDGEAALGTKASSDLMTVREAAEYLRIPLPTAYHYFQTGKLPSVKIGGRYRVKRSLIDREVLNKDDQVSQPTVLVVDDHQAIQTLFKKFLRKARMACQVVGSGTEAVAAVTGQKFDLVFLDLHLPDSLGDVVYADLKKIDPDLPIVLVTGHPDSQLMGRILSTGPVIVIQKPLEFEQLNQILIQFGHKGAKNDGRTRGG